MLREIVGLMPVAATHRARPREWAREHGYSSVRRENRSSPFLVRSATIGVGRGFKTSVRKEAPGCARALLSRIQVKPTSSLNLPLTNTRPTLQGDDNVLPRTSKAHRL